jgi:hypothetical protein
MTPGGDCSNGLTIGTPVTLTEGLSDAHQAILFYGIMGSPGLKVAAFSVEQEPLPGYTALRFVNAAPGLSSLDLGGDDGGTYDSLFHDALYGQAGKSLPGIPGYVDLGLPPSTFAIRASGSTTDLVETSPTTLAGDHAYTVLAVTHDTSGTSPVEAWLCEDAPAPSCMRISP